MSKAVLILAAVCCFLLVSSSISGGLYYFRCDLELVGCPSPETPSPSAQDPPYLVCKEDGFYYNKDGPLEKVDYPYEGDHHKVIDNPVIIERLEDAGHTNVGSCTEISNELVLYKVQQSSNTIYCAPLDKLDNPDGGFVYKNHTTDTRCPDIQNP